MVRAIEHRSRFQLFQTSTAALRSKRFRPKQVPRVPKFQLFQSFDGLTMSGFILNPLSSVQSVAVAQRCSRVEGELQVSRILETSKDSQNKVEATQFDNIGEENADLQESLPLDATPFGWQSWE